MSVFEKVILLYKKKRLSNDLLEERIAQLTKKIGQKKSINSALEK